MTWNAFSSGWLFGSASSPLSAVWSCSAGSASTTSTAADATAEITGCRRTGRRIAPQKRLPSPLSRRSRCTNGIRPFSTLSPSRESRAGRTVSEPIMATATTIIVPIANDMNVLSPERSMPAIAMITVIPEISTARPEVAAAASIAARSLRPGAPLVAHAADVEERVVDADGETDQQDHLVDWPSIGTIWLGSETSPSVANTARQPDQDRHERRDGRAEHEQQDDDREDERDQPDLRDARR